MTLGRWINSVCLKTIFHDVMATLASTKHLVGTSVSTTLLTYHNQSPKKARVSYPTENPDSLIVNTYTPYNKGEVARVIPTKAWLNSEPWITWSLQFLSLKKTAPEAKMFLRDSYMKEESRSLFLTSHHETSGNVILMRYYKSRKIILNNQKRISIFFSPLSIRWAGYPQWRLHIVGTFPHRPMTSVPR